RPQEASRRVHVARDSSLSRTAAVIGTAFRETWPRSCRRPRRTLTLGSFVCRHRLGRQAYARESCDFPTGAARSAREPLYLAQISDNVGGTRRTWPLASRRPTNNSYRSLPSKRQP